MKLKIKIVNDEVKSYYESRANHIDDSGFDLPVPRSCDVAGGSLANTLDFGIQIAAYDDNDKSIPVMLVPRSSISKTSLRMSNSIGIIDRGYRGNIMAKVDNISEHIYRISRGERLFQLVAFDGSNVDFEIVETLDKTVRGDGGFGSTGK